MCTDAVHQRSTLYGAPPLRQRLPSASFTMASDLRIGPTQIDGVDDPYQIWQPPASNDGISTVPTAAATVVFVSGRPINGITPSLPSPTNSLPSPSIAHHFQSRPKHHQGPIFMAQSNDLDLTIDHSSGVPDHFFRWHHPAVESSPAAHRHQRALHRVICVVHHDGDDGPILKPVRPHAIGTGNPPPAMHRRPASSVSVEGSDATLLYSARLPWWTHTTIISTPSRLDR
ncbi:hypothetical protein ACLOJK_007289 [Asimina triloba]